VHELSSRLPRRQFRRRFQAHDPDGLLDALKQKPAPFCYFDTHAGAGSYDLRGAQAEKTAEAADGCCVCSM
jgi:hypothetical protein